MHSDPHLHNFISHHNTFTWIGAYIGLVIEAKFIETRHYYHYSKTTLRTGLARFLVSSIIGLIITSSAHISKKNPLWIIVVAKTMLPVFLGNVYLFAFLKYLVQKLQMINTNIVSHADYIQEF